MEIDNESIFEAIGEILKDERVQFDGRFSEFEGRIKSLSDYVESTVAGVDQKLTTVDQSETIESLIETQRQAETSLDDVRKFVGVVADDLSEKVTGIDSQIQDKAAKADVSELLVSLKGLEDRFVDAQLGVEMARKRIDEMALELGEQVNERLAEVKDGEDGKDGKDGLDRQLVLPVKAAPGITLEKNATCVFGGGLFQAVRDTHGDPKEDPAGYLCIVDGIKRCWPEEDWTERKIKYSVEYTSGKTDSLSYDIGPQRFSHYPAHIKLVEGDSFLHDDHLYTVKRDGAGHPEEDPESYSADLIRGRRGRVGQKGEKGDLGPRGLSGEDGRGIDDVDIRNKTLYITMTDGEVKAFPIEELITFDEGDAPIKNYRGDWNYSDRYQRGDVVSSSRGLMLCIQDNARVELYESTYWVKMTMGGGGGGGGGGSGSGSFAGGAYTAGTPVNFQGFGLTNVGDPRTGNVGKQDAVNRDTMEKAIAAGALYQGIYTVETNNPDLAAKADSGFTPPAANSTIAKPNAAASDVSDPLNILTWHNWGGNGFDTFAATPTVPTAFEVRLSDGSIHKYNIPAKTYADEAALKAELDAQAAALGVVSFEVYVNGADCHIGVETVAPLYCTAIGGETGSAFPAAVPGAGNSILNTYNWVVQTKDENTPEALPPGLPGLPAGTVVKNSDVLQWSSTINGFEVISGSSLTQSFSDQRYWQINQGNMAWADQSYNKGAVVYGSTVNAWFVSTQNIPAGSPEPGKVAAAAIWRKINSTYGSTVFFGKGDYDSSDTTAANNWGMPTGTYPSGQQPLNGDSYFDVLSGSTTDFTVTEQPPIYTLSGSLGTKQLDVAGGSILNGWPNSFVGTAPGDHWDIAASATPFTFTGGVFAGETIPANTAAHIVWTGDPDADHSGWVLVLDPATTWSVTTPHAQKVTDVITVTTQYGYSRNDNLTMPTVAAGSNKWIYLVSQFPRTTAVTNIELRSVDTDGPVYEFQLITSKNAPPKIVPIAMHAKTDWVIEFVTHDYTAGDTYWIEANLGPAASGKDFVIEVTSRDFDLGLLAFPVSQAGAAGTGYADKIDGSADYPSKDLINFSKSTSGDASATLPDGAVLGQPFAGSIAITKGLAQRYTGRVQAKDRDAALRISFTNAAGNALNTQTWAAEWGQFLYAPIGTSGSYLRRIISQDVAPSGSGSFIELTAGHPATRNYDCFFDFLFDRRDPRICIATLKLDWMSNGVACSSSIHLKVDNSVDFAPGNFKLAADNSAIEVYSFKSLA